MIALTKSTLAIACGATPENAQKYLDSLGEACTRFEINTTRRMAAFLATVSVESARLTAVEEGLYYSDANRIASIFKRVFKGDPKLAYTYVGNPKGLSLVLYQGFHGRGLIQLTWEKNYRLCGDALRVDFLANPSLLCTPKYAAQSAAWFWHTNGCNQAADKSDMDTVTLKVNGPKKMHLAERKAQFEIAMKVL